MSLTDEILKLPTQWRALADDFNVTRGDSEVEAAIYRCADELEAVSREAVLGVVAGALTIERVVQALNETGCEPGDLLPECGSHSYSWVQRFTAALNKLVGPQP